MYIFFGVSLFDCAAISSFRSNHRPDNNNESFEHLKYFLNWHAIVGDFWFPCVHRKFEWVSTQIKATHKFSLSTPTAVALQCFCGHSISWFEYEWKKIFMHCSQCEAAGSSRSALSFSIHSFLYTGAQSFQDREPWGERELLCAHDSCSNRNTRRHARNTYE